MAQYYEVVGQINSQNPNEKLFNLNTEENGETVQYVITPQEVTQQQFIPQQQIVVANNQLILVNKAPHPQQVIIDKAAHVAYQSQPEQFIIQDGNTIDFQNTGQQRIFYMDGNSEQSEQLVVEHPVVINTQANNISPDKLSAPSQLVQTSELRTVRVPQQINSRPTLVVGQPENRMILNRFQQPRSQIQINLQQKNNLNSPEAQSKVVTQTAPERKPIQHQPRQTNNRATIDTMSNEGIISYAEFKKLQQQQKRLQNPVNKRTVNSSTRIPPINKPTVRLPSPRYTHSPVVQRALQQQRELKLQQQKLQQQKQKQQSQANYLIQPNVNQNPKQQRALPSFIPSSQIQQIIENTPISEEFSDSIRMLVLLDNGEQRLITFTLPKEACTIQEILEQVNVPFQADTKIQVSETNSNGINYIVTVGNVPNLKLEEEEEMDCEEPEPETEAPRPMPPVHIPKIIPGKLAVCGFCGYLSEDFSKCLRCRRVLPEDVKAVEAKRVSESKQLDSKIQISQGNKKRKSDVDEEKEKSFRGKHFENETVVLISDDEDDEKKQSRVQNTQIMQKLGNAITISPITKEPTFKDIQQHKIRVFPPEMETKPVFTSLECRSIRIGSYRFVSPDRVYFDSKFVTIKAINTLNDKEIIPIKIEKGSIVKVLASFNNTMPVIFFYLTPSLSETIRKVLGMVKHTEPYFDPLDKEERIRRITLLPEEISDDVRDKLRSIYGQPYNLLDELTTTEANDILIKICPKDGSKTPIMNMGEVKELLMYPPEGRVRIAINTEDYTCLGTDQFLNDVIIDFYLKYIVDNLPQEKREKVHVFSTFFYKRLTTKPFKATKKTHPIELDPNLTAAEKRHSRVKTWTKNINLFEKDFIIIPINENAHWFLAIICFPNMEGCFTIDGNEPYKIEAKTPTKKKLVKKSTARNVTIVQSEKSEKAILCDDGELSDKDEAEGDDSELDSDDSDSSVNQPIPEPVVKVKTVRPAIKQPCILIFDSLPGASRSRVVATLRDYLTCEYKAKMNKERVFNKDNIKGACPKVPQQTNFTDCGLYLLQYVEQFFMDPIKDYYIPIAGLKNWFDEITVTKKREDISILISDLMRLYKRDLSLVPDVTFPTLNGKLVETEEGEEEEEDLFEDIGVCMTETVVTTNTEVESESLNQTNGEEVNLNCPSTKGDSNEFVEQANVILKPDISELPKTTTNRETLSYLKAKRIVRHKNNEGPDLKKVKSD